MPGDDFAGRNRHRERPRLGAPSHGFVRHECDGLTNPRGVFLIYEKAKAYNRLKRLKATNDFSRKT